MLSSSEGISIMASVKLDSKCPELDSGIEISRSVSTGDLEKLIYTEPLKRGYFKRENRGGILRLDQKKFESYFTPKNGKSPRANSKTCSQKGSRKKFKWHDPISGYALTAGGILFYDEKGLWVIGEKDKNGLVYTDIGGRYSYEDGNIWATISRELREETYGICEMFASEIEALSKIYQPVYVNGHDNQPVYICLVIPISALNPESRRHFSLNPIMFDMQRRKVVEENPEVPEDYYCPCVLRKMTYEELKDPTFRLSFRLKRILKFSTAFSSLPPRSEPCSPYDTEEESTD